MKNNSLRNGAVPLDTRQREWMKIVMHLSFLVALTLILYLKAIAFHFIYLDDYEYILNNPLIRQMNWPTIKGIFTTPVLGMYSPLPILVYTIVHAVGGMQPMSFHLTNLLFYVIVIICIYWFFSMLTNNWLTGFLVALLFAVNPLHVSVVCWASQTKTSMYVIFYYLGMMQYLHYIRKGYQAHYYYKCIMMFILSILSKPSAVTFAPMLLLLDYYGGRKYELKVLKEKIPFMALAAGAGLLALGTHWDAKDSIFELKAYYSLWELILMANYSITFYIEKLLLPFNLSLIYRYPEPGTIYPPPYYFAMLVIPFILYLIYKSASFRKELIFGFLFFLIAISVMLRIIPTGFFGVANRYSYLPYAGLFFIIAKFITLVCEYKAGSLNIYRNYILTGFVLFTGLNGIITIHRIQMWSNTISAIPALV